MIFTILFCHYQINPGQSSCLTCPEMYYCNATFGPVVNFASYLCPEGYYCPNGTEHSEQYPCPKGTFNNRTGTKTDILVPIDRESLLKV